MFAALIQEIRSMLTDKVINKPSDVYKQAYIYTDKVYHRNSNSSKIYTKKLKTPFIRQVKILFLISIFHRQIYICN